MSEARNEQLRARVTGPRAHARQVRRPANPVPVPTVRACLLPALVGGTAFAVAAALFAGVQAAELLAACVLLPPLLLGAAVLRHFRHSREFGAGRPAADTRKELTRIPAELEAAERGTDE